MARRIPKPCAEVGCAALVYGTRYCLEHQRQARAAEDDRRGSSTERGYGSKWRKARDAFIAAHPLCARCEKDGRVVAATDVDHVIPHRLIEAKRSGDLVRLAAAQRIFWSRSNWQSLCRTCHAIAKQAEEAAARRN